MSIYMTPPPRPLEKGNIYDPQNPLFNYDFNKCIMWLKTRNGEQKYKTNRCEKPPPSLTKYMDPLGKLG